MQCKIALWIIKTLNSGKKYNIYFYAIIYENILNCLDYFRAITIAYSTMTIIVSLLTYFDKYCYLLELIL